MAAIWYAEVEEGCDSSGGDVGLLIVTRDGRTEPDVHAAYRASRGRDDCGISEVNTLELIGEFDDRQASLIADSRWGFPAVETVTGPDDTESAETRTERQSLADYCEATRQALDIGTAIKHGQTLAKLCRERDIPVDKARDRTGFVVNLYPTALLAEHFRDSDEVIEVEKLQPAPGGR